MDSGIQAELPLNLQKNIILLTKDNVNDLIQGIKKVAGSFLTLAHVQRFLFALVDAVKTGDTYAIGGVCL